jgi:hypothetical protein
LRAEREGGEIWREKAEDQDWDRRDDQASNRRVAVRRAAGSMEWEASRVKMLHAKIGWKEGV